MIGDLGLATTILIGVALGYGGYVVLSFWIGLIWKDFQYSDWYMRLFWVHLIIWVVATCIVPMDLIEETVGVWGKPCLIFYLISMALYAISKISKIK